jgi:hypothetical protein
VALSRDLTPYRKQHAMIGQSSASFGRDLKGYESDTFLEVRCQCTTPLKSICSRKPTPKGRGDGQFAHTNQPPPVNMTNATTSYKQQKVDFVSNLTGGSVSEILSVTAVAPVSCLPGMCTDRI